jgi:hypothetical protein
MFSEKQIFDPKGDVVLILPGTYQAFSSNAAAVEHALSDEEDEEPL